MGLGELAYGAGESSVESSGCLALLGSEAYRPFQVCLGRNVAGRSRQRTKKRIHSAANLVRHACLEDEQSKVHENMPHHECDSDGRTNAKEKGWWRGCGKVRCVCRRPSLRLTCRQRSMGRDRIEGRVSTISGPSRPTRRDPDASMTSAATSSSIRRFVQRTKCHVSIQSSYCQGILLPLT